MGDDLDRYSRQILVPGVDIEGQGRLAQASVLVVGCGGLGCPLALYLAAAGVGRITLYDDDTVEWSNLPRQVAFVEADVGQTKAWVLADRLRAMNSGIDVRAVPQRFDEQVSLEGIDLVLDASDSRQTRLAIEDSTRAAVIPWVMGSAEQMSGQWLAFDAMRDSGCYRCLAPVEGDSDSGGCARLGVLGPVVGIVALMQATQALRLLVGDDLPWGRLMIYDFRTQEQQQLLLRPRAGCSACDVS